MVEGPSRRRILSGTGLVAGAGLAGCLGIFEGDAGQTDGDGEAFPEPGRTITGIVPFGVGGGTDTFVRQLFEVLRNRYDVNTQVENIEGAGGLRGVGEGYKRDPDGYTIVFHNPPSTPLAEMLNPQDFDLTEFEAIAQYGVSPRVIGANSELGIESPEDLLGRYEDELTDAGGQGTANISEVNWHVFRENWGWDWDNYIPYPSAGELTTAIARGEVPCGSDSDATFEELTDTGDIDPVLTLHTSGSSIFPDVPTTEDAGLKSIDFIAAFNRCVWAPPETPQNRVETLSNMFKDVVQSDDMQQWADNTGNQLVFNGPEEANKLVKDAYDQIPKIIDLDEWRD